MQFRGSDRYVATDALQLAVNSAVTPQRPLLIKGEPGTGKTMLAEEVAQSLGMRLIQWHIKSTTKAHQGLYEYDAVSRLRDSQLGDDRVRDIKNYINKGKVFGEVEKDFFGNQLKPYRAINRKPITASEEELKRNNRARSAKLRIAERL